MIFIGIDFSILAPSVCINYGNKCKYLSIFKSNKKQTKKESEAIKILETFPNLKLIHNITNYETKNYQEREINNLIEAEYLTNTIIEYINNIVKDKKVKIVLEGFSYGSTGNRLAEISGFNYLLRHKIFACNYELLIYSPKSIKKIAGNGNFNKIESIEAFLNNENDDLQKFLLNNKEKLHINNKSWIKPVDDLVDSYWAMRTAEML